jgi:signal peptidase
VSLRGVVAIAPAVALPGWLRELLIVAAVLAVVVGGLTAYTQTWPPAVIVESGSMMHADDTVPYGRYGTIDPGDLVLVKKLGSPSDVQTLVENGAKRYGMPGDVLVYFPGDDHRFTPVIHRAIFYVEVTGSSYRVRWDPNSGCVGGAQKDPNDAHWCVYGAGGIDIPSLILPGNGGYRPTRSGFVTKGDNPATNIATDQAAGISHSQEPTPLSWVEGKARGELPWIGLIKLALAGHPNQDNPPSTWTKVGSAYAPRDLWVCLAVTLVVLVGGPFAWDVVKNQRKKKEKDEA